jgi:AAA+ superfamily predicted ATPase
VIAVDVADADMLQRVLGVWRETLFASTARVMDLGVRHGGRDDHDVVLLAIEEPQTGKKVVDREREALWALQLALPLIAISPSAETHLAHPILKAAPVRIRFPSLDPATIALAIRVVTGRPCRDLLDETIAACITPTDMIVAIRFDRAPGECMAELRRLAADKRRRKTGRDLTLDEIHGMEGAVDWAQSAIRDLNAWRRGDIPWSAVEHGACLVGPPGTGKTMFASAFARAAGLEMIPCSLAQWQGADEGHLGHLLRAMKRDFERARAVPSVLFIDEIDSFADRNKVRHGYADYAVQVVNGFIAELDGVAGREGVIFLAASNELSRCDPAILRSGRLNRIIPVALPNAMEIERMLRVRLGGALAVDQLDEIALLALGSTGADIERIVKDAKRFARHRNRSVEFTDLRKAVVGGEERDPAEIERTAIHEAGHILMDILCFGDAEHLHATVTASGTRGGITMRTRPPYLSGTYEDYNRRLQIFLAGRIAEEIVLDAVSHGGGGGRGSDLDQGTKLAAAMVASLGLAGPAPLLYLGAKEDTDKLLSYPEVRSAVHTELVQASESCRTKLLEHRDALEEVAAKLLRNGKINGAAVAAILSPGPKSNRVMR